MSIYYIFSAYDEDKVSLILWYCNDTLIPKVSVNFISHVTPCFEPEEESQRADPMSFT